MLNDISDITGVSMIVGQTVIGIYNRIPNWADRKGWKQKTGFVAERLMESASEQLITLF